MDERVVVTRPWKVAPVVANSTTQTVLNQVTSSWIGRLGFLVTGPTVVLLIALTRDSKGIR